jgi:ERF superfamily
MEKLNIYIKLQKIQSEIKELIRTEENKFQKYKFFDELQVLKHLKPLLEKYKLLILPSDNESKEFIREQQGNMYLVQYWKRMEIFNAEIPEEKVIFSFVAIGQNNDPAKAKGSAETYAIKYFLSKLFLIPVKDEMDPDYRQEEKKDGMNFEERKKVNEFLKKHGWGEKPK